MINSRCLERKCAPAPIRSSSKRFRACGFIASASVRDSSRPMEEAETSEADDNGLAAALSDVRFKEYVAVGSTVETSGVLTDIETIETVRLREAGNESEIDDDVETEPQPPAADVAAGQPSRSREQC
ncbi:hypothetical protein ISCGN_000025 [Ixodes scapularis]